MTTSLVRQKSPLAQASYQLRILHGDPGSREGTFDAACAAAGLPVLTSERLDVLQVNVGRVCNQTCRHCHVDAGPDRRESMCLDVVEACLELLERAGMTTLDITGGAPEMHPHFRHIVRSASQLSVRVIDRSNLTILVAPGFEDLPEFLARHEVEIVASLPCYLESNVDAQRGDNVFQRSLEALRRLNALGYGMPDSQLPLTLVYNPSGPALPPSQPALEQAYRRELRSRYGIEFTRLFTITNMPISRFLDDLLSSGQYDDYMRVLIESFNPATITGLMCRTMLSVDWRGYLYDCDFNQMLDLQFPPDMPRHISQLNSEALGRLIHRRIATGRHCFGCTAGSGSGCHGALDV